MDDLSPPPPSTGSGQGPSTLRQSSGQAGSGQSFFSLPVFFGFAAGIFAGVALALLAFLAFYLLREEEDAASSPAPLALPSPVATAASSDASEPRTVSALSVHIGPSEGYAALGTLRRGETLQIVGRSADATWLAVRFPPGSNGLGWVPLNGVSGVEDVQSLAIAFPTPLPRGPSFFGSDGSDDGRFAVTPTPTPQSLPDLVVTSLTRLADGRISVTIANQGGDLRDRGFISVRVSDLVGDSEEVTAATTELRAGASLALVTSVYRVEKDQVVIATVNPNGSVTEKSLTNNTLRVEIDVAP